MIALIASVIPVLLRVLGYYFDSQEASAAKKEAFLKLLEVIVADAGSSMALRSSAEAQKARLLARVQAGELEQKDSPQSVP